MDQTPRKPHRAPAPKQFHLRVNIDDDAYEMLKEECYLDASGRHMGLGRAVNKCIYIALGYKRRDARLCER